MAWKMTRRLGAEEWSWPWRLGVTTALAAIVSLLLTVVAAGALLVIGAEFVARGGLRLLPWIFLLRQQLTGSMPFPL